MLGLKKYLTVLGALSLSLLFTSCGGNSQNSSSSNNNAGGSPNATSGTTTGGTNSGGTGSSNSPVSFAYVGTNGFSAGMISGFAVNADGTASAIASVNGASSGLATNDHFLLGTDGTNVVAYLIGSGGTLSQASTLNGVAHNDTPDGSAVATLSLDRTGTSLYAGEINFEGTDNGGVAHFEIASNGGITWIDNSGISSNFGSNLAFSQDNKYAYGHGCYFLSFDVTGFSRSITGTLTGIQTNAQPPAAGENTDICPGPSSASSANSFLVAAMFPVGQQGAADLLVTYQIHADGSLSLATNSAPNSGFKTINDVKVDPSGNYVAIATDTGVHVYSLSSAGALTPMGSSAAPNVTFNALQWDKSDHLFAVSNTANALYIFNNVNGALTQATGSPHAVSNPGTLAVAAAH
jgi:hypothetical protein